MHMGGRGRSQKSPPTQWAEGLGDRYVRLGKDLVQVLLVAIEVDVCLPETGPVQELKAAENIAVHRLLHSASDHSRRSILPKQSAGICRRSGEMALYEHRTGAPCPAARSALVSVAKWGLNETPFTSYTNGYHASFFPLMPIGTLHGTICSRFSPPRIRHALAPDLVRPGG